LKETLFGVVIAGITISLLFSIWTALIRIERLVTPDLRYYAASGDVVYWVACAQAKRQPTREEIVQGKCPASE
jgi:hypothetical protein